MTLEEVSVVFDGEAHFEEVILGQVVVQVQDEKGQIDPGDTKRDKFLVG